METLITQDYEFVKNSLLYGQFLVECYEHDPDIKFKNIDTFYPYKTGASPTIMVGVEVTESFAVVLKLRFGECLRKRREPIRMTKKVYVDYDTGPTWKYVNEEGEVRNYVTEDDTGWRSVGDF